MEIGKNLTTFCVMLMLSAAPLFTFAQSVTFGGTIRDSYSKLTADSVRVDIAPLSDPSFVTTVYTSPSGTWSYSFSPAGVGSEPNIAASFGLEQNFPNPFNPSTTIPFQVSLNGTAVITVHNILGQLVDTRSYDVAPGRYLVRWNARGAAGTYFYTIRSGGRSETRRMLLLDGGHGDGLSDIVRTGSVATVPKRSAASDHRIIFSKFGYEPDTVIVPPVTNMAIDRSITTIHRRAFVVDLHNDISESMVTGYQLGVRHTSGQSDLPRFLDGGIDAQMFVMWPDPSDGSLSPYLQTVRMYDTCMAQFARSSAYITQTRTADEVRAANNAGKIAAILCVEGGIAIEEDLGKLIDLYNRGARYLTITWNNSTSWATSAADPLSTTKGLSDFGKQVIRTMDSLGMLIDVSHTGIKTIEDILTVTKNPIIASHSGARALREHTRNLTDAQIKAIADRGGVIGVVFYTSFLSASAASTVNIDTVIKHIDHIRDIGGIDCLAIGADYEGGITAPVGLEHVGKLQSLTMALLRHGYSPADVRKILGENYRRVFSAVCH